LVKRIQQDYKPAQRAPRRSDHRIAWFVAGVGIPLISVALMVHDGGAPATPAAAETTAAAVVATDIPLPQPAAPTGTVEATDAVPAPQVPATRPTSADRSPPARRGTQLSLEIRRGDSLDRIFRRHGLDRRDLAHVMLPELSRQYLRLLKPGEEITIRHDAGKVLALTKEINVREALAVWRSDHGFIANVLPLELQVRQKSASARIISSLFEAAAEAGLSERIIMNLAGIFAWDIDFVLDIRNGDEFKLIYEEYWRDGKHVADGEILAAEFINRGNRFRAIRYVDPTGRADYFTPEGNSVRKAFLRAPVDFTRISSNFNPRRRHPILHTIRAHRGVDYAAPRGTPVKAAGDGKVIHRGPKGGYGNAIILQHGSNITTLYAHLSRFAKGIRYGRRVRQGDIIGYVGSTGLATAPHLHYEYRRNGVHLNPRTVKLPDADPIDPAYLKDFQRVAGPLLQELGGHQQLIVQNSAPGE